MLWRCSKCGKAGLEDDFVFSPVDETHETIFCFDCAPPEAMQQEWAKESDDEDYKKEKKKTVSLGLKPVFDVNSAGLFLEGRF